MDTSNSDFSHQYGKPVNSIYNRHEEDTHMDTSGSKPQAPDLLHSTTGSLSRPPRRLDTSAPERRSYLNTSLSSDTAKKNIVFGNNAVNGFPYVTHNSVKSAVPKNVSEIAGISV